MLCIVGVVWFGFVVVTLGINSDKDKTSYFIHSFGISMLSKGVVDEGKEDSWLVLQELIFPLGSAWILD